MTLRQKYENVEKHGRREIEKVIAETIGVLDFWFSYIYDDRVLTVSFNDVMESRELKMILKKYFAFDVENDLTEEIYDSQNLGEDFAVELIKNITSFKTITDVMLTDESSSVIIFGSK